MLFFNNTLHFTITFYNHRQWGIFMDWRKIN